MSFRIRHAAAAAAALSACAALAARVPVLAASAATVPIREGQTVTWQTRGEPVKAYLSRPMEGGPLPGVVVIHEWWGLNDQIKGVGDRLAEQGYIALVPDFYHGKVPTDAGLAHELMRGLNENYAVQVIKDGIKFLRDLDAKENRRPPDQEMPIGTLGFCMGGRLSLAAALKEADIQACAMFYGSVETDPKELAPLAVPLLGIFGNEDHGIPIEEIKAFESALKDAGKQATILVYPGVGHAFFNEERPGFDREAAADAWNRTKVFFHDTLKATPAEMRRKEEEEKKKQYMDYP
jgi:carboxymethylenebutenolidase